MTGLNRETEKKKKTRLYDEHDMQNDDGLLFLYIDYYHFLFSSYLSSLLYLDVFVILAVKGVSSWDCQVS
jgi:hypothetical protein